MTVKELKQELDKFPDDMPVATVGDIGWSTKDDPHWIKVTKKTWIHTNYPYDKPEFEYVDLE